jgi:hypothetical protein
MEHGADAPFQVAEKTAKAVRTLIDDYLEPHARKVYAHIEAHPARAGALRIAKWIRADRVSTFTASNIRERDWREFKQKRDRELIEDAANYLEGKGWLRICAPATGPKGGRPVVRYTVNPRVFQHRA